MAHEIISRADARARGLLRYFVGTPCKHGHVSERLVSSGVCIACRSDIERRYNESHLDKLRNKWRQQSKRHRQENPDRIRNNKQRWVEQNKEKIAERNRRWSAENQDKRRAYGRAAIARDPKKYREKHRKWLETRRHDSLHKQKAIARTKRWIAENPEQKRAQARKGSHTRRARMYKAGGSYTSAEINVLIETQNWLCAEPTCGADLRVGKELDHIIPVSLRGPNHIRNLQWLCIACNRSKRNKYPIEWAKERRRSLTEREIKIMSEYTVEELEIMLAAAKAEDEHHEFPRWVEPHESHVVRKAATEDGAPPSISAPAFADIFVARDGKLSVLVHNEEEEAKAIAIAVPYDDEKKV